MRRHRFPGQCVAVEQGVAVGREPAETSYGAQHQSLVVEPGRRVAVTGAPRSTIAGQHLRVVLVGEQLSVDVDGLLQFDGGQPEDRAAARPLELQAESGEEVDGPLDGVEHPGFAGDVQRHLLHFLGRVDLDAGVADLNRTVTRSGPRYASASRTIRFSGSLSSSRWARRSGCCQQTSLSLIRR